MLHAHDAVRVEQVRPEKGVQPGFGHVEPAVQVDAADEGLGERCLMYGQSAHTLGAHLKEVGCVGRLRHNLGC